MQPKGGSERLVRLFETCLETPISRIVIASVAAQDDFMKRLRRNGGARDHLAKKGIAIFYSEKDRDLMKEMGLNFGSREFMSFKPKDEKQTVRLRDLKRID